MTFQKRVFLHEHIERLSRFLIRQSPAYPYPLARIRASSAEFGNMVFAALSKRPVSDPVAVGATLSNLSTSLAGTRRPRRSPILKHRISPRCIIL